MRRFALVKSIVGTAVLAATLAVAPLGAQSFKGRGNDGVPEGHRPPPGLSPLSPSERFLAEEASRGLRDLQLFLLDAA